MHLKIAIVVHGRYHAFDLARALLARGHAVTLFTNYPKWAVKQFGIAEKHVKSYWSHGILTRMAWRMQTKLAIPFPEATIHKMFGRWAASKLKTASWDVICGWSGVSEEIFRTSKGTETLCMLTRGSSHIVTQARLLQEEARRTGKPLDHPSLWMIEREQREYSLADNIRLISSFAYDSFIEQGIPPWRLSLVKSGADVTTFHPSAAVAEARYVRILTGAPLRILTIGTFSLRKGMFDLQKVIQQLHTENFEFRFVGPVASEAVDIAQNLERLATFIPKQPHQNLPEYYAWGDIFVQPTIEDGFQTVLNQAAAAGLPIITTPNGAGHDIVNENTTGWVVPIRTPDAIVERLRWCNEHRHEVTSIAQQTYENFQLRTWEDTAKEFEDVCWNHRRNNLAQMQSSAKGKAPTMPGSSIIS